MSSASPNCWRNLDDAPELLTVAQAAWFLGMGKSTLYRKLDSGEVPVGYIDTLAGIRISRRLLVQWLETPRPVAPRSSASGDEAVTSKDRLYAEISARLGGS